MDPSNYPPLTTTPLMFRALFVDCLTRAGALSALPDAPVVPERAPRRRPQLGTRLARAVRRLSHRRRRVGRTGPCTAAPAVTAPPQLAP